MTDLSVLAFVECPSGSDSSEAKYSSTELNLGELISFRLPFVDRFFINRVFAPNEKGQPSLTAQRLAALHGQADHFDCRAPITNQVFRAMNSAT